MPQRQADVLGTACGGQVDVYAGGVQAGNEFLRLDYLARAAMGITKPPVEVLLGVACSNDR